MLCWCIGNPSNIDSNNPQFEVYLAAHLAVAEQENFTCSDNVVWGLHAGVEQGTTKLYNEICYGYKHDKDGYLIINEDEAETVRFSCHLYLGGYSVLGIIKKSRFFLILGLRSKNNKL